MQTTLDYFMHEIPAETAVTGMHRLHLDTHCVWIVNACFDTKESTHHVCAVGTICQLCEYRTSRLWVLV